MTRCNGRLVLSGAILLAAVAVPRQARAQYPPGPGTWQGVIIPGGGMFFSEGKNQSGPRFGNYTFGGAVTLNFDSNWWAAEVEVSTDRGVTQNLTQGGVTSRAKTPSALSYTGNAVLSLSPLWPRNRALRRRFGWRANPVGAFEPYLTAGVGGLTLHGRPAVGFNDGTTFLAGNVGGGLKWWWALPWGLRVDYRFIGVKSRSDAPAFFGRENRYGHRISVGVMMNLFGDNRGA